MYGAYNYTDICKRSIAHLFGVAKSTTCQIVDEVYVAILQMLFGQYITIPSQDRLESIIQGFANDWNFPQCAGAIDGYHIPIQAPQECPKDYYNRKRHHSILLQGLVDHCYCFMDIKVGWPGSVHDARVLVNSELFRRGVSGELFPQMLRHNNKVSVPLVVLGDTVYPLLQWMMNHTWTVEDCFSYSIYLTTI